MFGQAKILPLENIKPRRKKKINKLNLSEYFVSVKYLTSMRLE